MKEDKQDARWYNKPYGKLISLEEGGGDGAIVGKFIAQKSLVYKPSYEQTGEESPHG